MSLISTFYALKSNVLVHDVKKQNNERFACTNVMPLRAMLAYFVSNWKKVKITHNHRSYRHANQNARGTATTFKLIEMRYPILVLV